MMQDYWLQKDKGKNLHPSQINFFGVPGRPGGHHLLCIGMVVHAWTLRHSAAVCLYLKIAMENTTKDSSLHSVQYTFQYFC